MRSLSFRTLKRLSFTHSAIYLTLLTVWLVPGLHQLEFIFGMAQLGIVYAGWNPDWFYFFLGALLLGAIVLNTYIRRRAEASR